MQSTIRSGCLKESRIWCVCFTIKYINLPLAIGVGFTSFTFWQRGKWRMRRKEKAEKKRSWRWRRRRRKHSARLLRLKFTIISTHTWCEKRNYYFPLLLLFILRLRFMCTSILLLLRSHLHLFGLVRFLLTHTLRSVVYEFRCLVQFGKNLCFSSSLLTDLLLAFFFIVFLLVAWFSLRKNMSTVSRMWVIELTVRQIQRI